LHAIERVDRVEAQIERIHVIGADAVDAGRKHAPMSEFGCRWPHLTKDLTIHKSPKG
jgi:hypothetical protein